MGEDKPERILDYTIVPAGVVFFLVYHLYLLHRILTRPMTTVIGVNDHSRKRWVEHMLSDQEKNGLLCVHIFRNNLMGSIKLASTSITLCSLIVVLLNYKSENEELYAAMIYGDDGEAVRSVKYFSILFCFLVAFLCNVESIRYYNHASFLVNAPLGYGDDDDDDDHSVDYVVRTVNRGSYWWSLGLKAFYLSFPLFLWVFGPIPMFVSCVLMVVLLFFIDRVPDGSAREEAPTQ